MGETLTRSDIKKFTDEFFSKHVVFRASVQRGAAKKMKTKERLIWPVEMICGCERPEALEVDYFDAALNLASCHFVLWSWYFALYEALKASDTRQQHAALSMQQQIFFIVFYSLSLNQILPKKLQN